MMAPDSQRTRSVLGSLIAAHTVLISLYLCVVYIYCKKTLGSEESLAWSSAVWIETKERLRLQIFKLDGDNLIGQL